MATLAEEIRKSKAAASLLNSDETDDTDPDPDVSDESSGDSTDEQTKESERETPIYAPATKRGPSYILVPLDQPKPEATVYPTIAQDQGQPDTRKPPAAPSDIQTDEETGTKFVTDKDTGLKIPHAELATEADKEAFRPSDVTLPKVDVAGAQPVRRAELVDPDPDFLYAPEAEQPEPEVRRAAQVGVTPKAEPVTPRPEAKPVVVPAPPPAQPAQPPAPTQRASVFGLTPDEYKASLTAEPATTTTTTTTQPVGDLNINTDWSAQPGSYASGRGNNKIQGIVLHSSDGREKGDLNTLTSGGVSAHYYVTRDGRIYNLVNDNDTAYHAGKVVGALNNSNTIGIEQEHFDPGGQGGKNGEAWSPAQVAATARLVASLKAKYGLTDDNIVGHSDVAPGRKQDPYNYPWQGFLAAVDKAGTGDVKGFAGPSGPPGPAGPAGKAAPLEGASPVITGRATTFGHFDTDDPGVGAPRLGKINTNDPNLIGLAVPEEALRAYIGANPSTWRKARVEIVTQDGRHLLVPIVDLGPRDTSDKRGVVADFTYGLNKMLGNTGEQNYQFRIVPNAGPDVAKNPQSFADEQAAIASGQYTGPKAKGPAKASYVLQPTSPAESVSAQTAAGFERQGQLDNLNQFAAGKPNVVGLYKELDKDVPGVTPAMRQQFQANLKPQIISLMREKYPELNDNQAWDKALTDVNALDVGNDFWNKFVGSFQQLTPLLQQATGVRAEQSHVNAFLDQVLPKGSDADKNALLTKLYKMPPEQRGPYVASLIPNPQAGVPGQDAQQVVSALDRLSSPDYAKQQAAQMQQAQAALKQRLATDPRLANTPAAWASENLASMPEMILASNIPPLMAAQVGQQVRDQMKAEHPDWSEDDLDRNSAYATLVQFVGQEAAGRLFGAGVGTMVKGLKSPVQRAIAQALMQTGGGAAISAAAQAGTNIVTGEPPEKGVVGAGLAGALQGGVAGGLHGVGELLHRGPTEVRLPTEVRPPAEVKTEPPLGEETAITPPQTGEKGAPVRGAEERTMETGGETPPRAETTPAKEETAPVTDQASDNAEAALNQQAEQIYQGHQAGLEGKPIEEQSPAADIIQQHEESRAGEVAPRDTGASEAEMRGPSVDERTNADDRGRPETGSGANVPPQLGRVRGTLDTKLSHEESAAFEPDRAALRAAQPGTPEFTQAFRNLRERVIARFQPILDALGVRRLPDDYVSPVTGRGHAFAADRGDDGALEMHAHLGEGARDNADIMRLGGDPVENLHSSVQEEIQHLAHMQAVEDEWNQRGGQKGTGETLKRYTAKRNADLIREAIRQRDAYQAKGDTKHANLIDQALLNSIRLYGTEKFPTEQAARAHLDSMLADSTSRGDNDLYGMASELVRQLGQAGAKEPLTESHFKTWWQAAGDFYRRALDGLISLYRKLGPRGALAKTELAKMVRMVKAKIAAIDKIVADKELTSADRAALDELESYRQESDEDLKAAVKFNGDPKARQVLEERQAERLKHQAEMQGELKRPTGQEHLLQAIVKAGGLPHPLRMRALAAKGEKATGEMARVYDAWKALPLEVKKELGKEGVTYNKLFSKKGEGLDTFRGDLAQHPEGYQYGTTGELLSEVERALSEAGQGKRVYGSGGALEAPQAPRPIKEDSEAITAFRAGRYNDWDALGDLYEKYGQGLPEGLQNIYDEASRTAGAAERHVDINNILDKQWLRRNAMGDRYSVKGRPGYPDHTQIPIREPSRPTLDATSRLALEAPRAPREEQPDFALEVQRARAARKLKPAVQRAKPTEFKWGQPEAFRLEHETTGGGIKEPPKPPPAPDTTGDLFLQRPRTPGGKGRMATALGEKGREFADWYSAVFKGGESFLLDRKETRPLAMAERLRPSLAQKFGARAGVHALADAFNSISGRNRARVVQEFTDYVKAEQNKQPLPAVSADTRRVLDAGKHTLEQLGQIAKELNVHVKTSDGKIRPMQLIGRDYYPRMISADTHDIINHRDDTRAAEFNKLVNDQIAKGVVKSRDEFLDKFAQATAPDTTTNGHFNNVEKAREAKLPLDFYDFSPEALLKYAGRATDRLAQVGAYGQKLSNKGKDLFDHTIEKVQASRMPFNEKQMVINRIRQESRAEYAETHPGNLDKVSRNIRSLASGLFLGNPVTSMYNLISGAAQNLTFGGPGAFLKTAGHFLSVKKALDSMKEARERNILKSNLSEILHDYDLVTDQGWATKGVQGFTQKMLHWGGQNVTEGVNRAFAMQQAKYILQRFARIYGQDNAGARSLYAMIQRRGIHDLSGLAKEKGSGPLTDEFLRQFVMDVHGNYGPSQSAAHLFDSPAGKILTQFQKWGANTQRNATREFLMPMVKAVRERKPADFAYHFTRNLAYLAAAVGAGGIAQMMRNLVTGKDPNDPTVKEIWKRFAQGENGRAMQLAFQRAWGAVILSGFTGTIGNYADLAGQLTGAQAGGRVKDPLHPPGWGAIQPIIEFFQGWHGESNFSAAPSPRLWDALGQNISSQYRVGKPILLNATNAAGLKMPLGQEYAAKNDLQFLRSRLKQFEDEDPALRAKREAQGTKGVSSAGRGPFDPIRDDIQAALLTGHPEEAQRRFADWLERYAPADQKAQLKAIKQSIQSSSPIKPGGSYSLDTELRFLDWAKQNLPEDEARKIFATAQTYAKTAVDTGIFPKSKTMQTIAKLDFDKYVVSTPKATAKVTVVRPGQPSLADQIRKELAAKALLKQNAPAH